MAVPAVFARIDAADRAVSGRVLAQPCVGRRDLWLEVVHRVSQTGSYGVGWVLLFSIVITTIEDWKVAALAAACVLGTLVINTGIKLLIRRPRPGYNTIGEQATTFSFPSAHTSMAVVGAAAITVVAPAFALLWWGWAAVLAVSRVILGMHYVGDILGGIVVGSALAHWVVVPLMHNAVG